MEIVEWGEENIKLYRQKGEGVRMEERVWRKYGKA